MRLIAIAAALLGACTAEPELPHVVIYADPQLAGDVAAVAAVWEPLGFTFGEPRKQLPQCYLHWTRSELEPCEISVIVHVGTDDILRGNLGVTVPDLRTAWVDVDAGRPWLVMAHEVGHVLLDSNSHLLDGERGVMAWTSALIEEQLTDADRRLACRNRGVC